MITNRRYMKFLRFKCLLGKRLEKLLKRDPAVAMDTYVDFYKDIWAGVARDMGAEFVELTRGVWKVSLNGKETLIDNDRVQIDDPVRLSIAGHKALSNDLMKELGLAVTDYKAYSLDTIEYAFSMMRELKGQYFVVKPTSGTAGGRGVSTHIYTLDECLKASILASLYGRELIIERLVAGESFRLLVLGGKMLHAVRRRGLWTRGDGKSTVKKLASELKKWPVFAKSLSSWNIKSDRDFLASIVAQGLEPTSIPEKGRKILLKSILKTTNYVELRTTYDDDVTNDICPELKEEAERAASSIGSDFAGIDIITTNLGLPLSRSGGIIVEINTTPGLHHHYNLATGPADEGMAAKVLTYLLKGTVR